VKVSELAGALLDMWVAKAEGKDACPTDHITSRLHTEYCFTHKKPINQRYSTDWSQGGPIIGRDKITLEPSNDKWYACYGPCDKEPMWVWEEGETALIAAMRCYVISKYGEEVPDE
jgi:hypothetical protein